MVKGKKKTQYNINKGDGKCVKNHLNCPISAIFVISETEDRDYIAATEARVKQQGGDGG